MNLAYVFSASLTAVIIGLLISRPAPRPAFETILDAAARESRSKVGLEMRGLVLGIVGPCLGGIWTGYLATDYLLPMLLFLVAGFLIASRIAPAHIRE